MDTKQRLKKIQWELDRMNNAEEVNVRDTVKGGDGGRQLFTVEGFPFPEYKRRRTQLMERQLKLDKLSLEIKDKLEEVEKFIDSVGDSRKRLILRWRYIDCMTWHEIAKKLGPGNNEDSIRIEISRFLNRN